VRKSRKNCCTYQRRQSAWRRNPITNPDAMGRREQAQNSTRHLLKKRQQRSPITASLKMEKSSHTGREEKQRSNGAEARGGYERKAEESGSRSRHRQKREEYTKRRGKLGVNPDRRMRNPTMQIFRPLPGTSRHKYTATTE
jgi:hypothetical protein